jgi:hypothetical protein
MTRFLVSNLGQAAPSPGSREELVKALVRQAQRYHFASLQDQNLLVAARHNAYAAGILGVVIEQSTDEEVKSLLGISLKDLRRDVHAMQDRLESKAFSVLKKLEE